METVPLKRYWPYDEVTTKRDCSSGLFTFSTPWLNVEIHVDDQDRPKVSSLLEKLASETLSPNDLAEVNWLFSSLSQHSLCYLLPRPELSTAKDLHILVDKTLLNTSPQEMLEELSSQVDESSLQHQAFNRMLQKPLQLSEWKWDASAALSFSAIASGHDPMSLFSIARRFHLLESVENNKTEALFQFIREMRSDAESFRETSARMVRQNHYVTQKCDSALRPALEIAQNAKSQVLKFIQAEAGHDVLLKRAMKGLGIANAETVQVEDSVLVLMEVFKLIAQRNFLAFSMVVDMFERSSYLDQDPLATLLEENGQKNAAKQIDIHREINDSGEHENVGISFLESMSAVDAEYATEALRLAELVTYLLHQISSTILDELRA